MELETVSIGSTPSMMHDFPILEGVTEIRPGTYIFMDASQANAYGSLDRNAATVLTTIISRPTAERVITDVGAKGITAQTRSKGFCATQGLGPVSYTHLRSRPSGAGTSFYYYKRLCGNVYYCTEAGMEIQ